MRNCSSDIALIQEMYNDYDNSYFILISFAYCYLEELI